MIGREGLVEAIAQLIKRSATTLPDDVKEALRRAYSAETSRAARSQLRAIIENVEVAEEGQVPVCQDTGLVCVYADVDPSICDPRLVEHASREAVRRATVEVPLRPNAVHPLSRSNTGDNVGVGVPYVEVDFNDEGVVRLTVMLKGAGSENATRLFMLPPLAGVKGIIRSVVDAVAELGGMACPPLVIGVGVGGVAEEALRLAKRSLLRPVGSRSSDGEAARLEEAILRAVNGLGIGCMGLGGSVTALDVHVELAHCHTASLPVAVALQCWALRRSSTVLRGV